MSLRAGEGPTPSVRAAALTGPSGGLCRPNSSTGSGRALPLPQLHLPLLFDTHLGPTTSTCSPGAFLDALGGRTGRR